MFSWAEGGTERCGGGGGVKLHQTNLDGQDLIAVQSSQRREPWRPLEDKHGITAGDQTHTRKTRSSASKTPPISPLLIW